MLSLLKKLLCPVELICPAVISGMVLSLSFPPVSFGASVFFALVPLLVVILRNDYSRSEVTRAGFFFGIFFFVLLLWWVRELLPWANVTVPFLMTPALILMVVYLAFYPAVFFLVLDFFCGKDKRPAIVVGPALWVLCEVARSKGELGFPWGAMGYGFTDYENLIQIASFVGIFGLSFMAVLVNFMFAFAFLEARIIRRLVFITLGLSIIVADVCVGHFLVRNFEGEQFDKNITVACIQPNIDLKIKWNPAFTDSIFSTTERLCERVSHLEPDIFIFPETSAPVYIHFEVRYRKRLSDLAKKLGKPIFIGFLDASKDKKDGKVNVYNAAGLFSSDGILVEQYEKVHLLPFGEALPLSSRFHFLRKINFGQANFQPGKLGSPIFFHGTSFAPLICFESIFPELSTHYVRKGAEFIVNITNDGWFGDTPGPSQHAKMCILRAVENRRVLVRSANTGISMIVDPVGRVTSSLGLNRQGTLVERIPLIKYKTFYARFGERPLLGFMFLLVFAGALRKWRNRRSPADL